MKRGFGAATKHVEYSKKKLEYSIGSKWRITKNLSDLKCERWETNAKTYRLAVGGDQCMCGCVSESADLNEI